MIKHQWFHDFDTFLANERYTPPVVRQLFYNHLLYECYLGMTYPSPLEYDDNDIIRAITAQQKIGWKQLLYGRLSILWGTLVGNHLSANQVPDKEMTMEQWGKIVVKMIFQLILTIWDSRNNDGHFLNERKESQLSRQRILDIIAALQDSNPDVRYSDRDFVYCDMEVLEQYSLGNLLSWYKSACSIIQVQKKYRVPQTSIRDCFPVIPAPFPGLVPVIIPPPEPDPNPTVALLVPVL